MIGFKGNVSMGMNVLKNAGLVLPLSLVSLGSDKTCFLKYALRIRSHVKQN